MRTYHLSFRKSFNFLFFSDIGPYLLFVFPSRLTGRSSTKRSSMAASFNATGTTSSPSPPPHSTHRQKQADPDHTAQMTEGQDLQPEPGRPVIPGGPEEMGGWGDVDGEGEGELIQRPDSRGMSTFRSSTTSIHGQLFPQKKVNIISLAEFIPPCFPSNGHLSVVKSPYTEFFIQEQ